MQLVVRYASILAMMCMTSVFLPARVFAAPGRSGPTTITHIIVKETYVEIMTNAKLTDEIYDYCSEHPKGLWALDNTHPYFEAMFSGLLAAKLAGGTVSIVGNGTCSGSYQHISWAYVAM